MWICRRSIVDYADCELLGQALRGTFSLRIAVLPSLIAPVREGACFGGAEIAALGLAEALARRGHDLTLIGLSGSGGDGLRTFVVPHGTPILRPGTNPTGDGAGPLPEIIAWVERLARSGALDALHLHLIDPDALLLADALARRCPELAVVSTLHVAAVFAETAAMVGRLISEGTPIRFTAPSRFTAKSYGAEDAFTVIPNGVDTSRIELVEVAPRDRRLVWAGRRSREKGLNEAIAIAALLGRPLTIAGPPAPEAEDGTEDPSGSELRLGAQVEDLGWIPRSEVYRALGRAEATLVTSSIPESQSLVAIESLAAGTPVVAFSGGGLSEVIDHGGTGFLVPGGDVAAAARAVERVGEIARGHCREVVKARFEERRTVDRFERVLGSGKSETGS